MTTTNDSTTASATTTCNPITPCDPLVIESNADGAVSLNAFERTRDVRAALDPKSLLVPNLDVDAMWLTFRGALPKLLAMRGAIVAEFRTFDITNLDRLADYFFALRYAHGVWFATTQPSQDLPALQARALVLRDALYADASGLVIRGLVPAAAIKEYKTKVGYKTTTGDLNSLVQMFRGPWGALAPRTGRAALELDEAEALNTRIADIVGGRATPPELLAKVIDDRQRAFTVAVNAYDQVRRAVLYLQANEADAETIAPSLYAGRNNGGRKKSDTGSDGPTTEPGSATPVSESHAVAASAAAPSAPLAAPAEIAPGSGLSSSTAIGMPGATRSAGENPHSPATRTRPALRARAVRALTGRGLRHPNVLSHLPEPTRKPTPMPTPSTLYLGATRPLDGTPSTTRLAMPANHLVTHGVIVGMTGSGKTGLVTVTVEEALRSGIPVLAIDVKGDLPNLLLTPPVADPSALLAWAPGMSSADDPRPVEAIAASLAESRASNLAAWGLGESDVTALRDGSRIRVITPGSTAGEPLHVLSSLERRSAHWDTDEESARSALSAAVSLVLRLLGRDADPAKSREHVLLSVLAELRLRAGKSADLGSLMDDLTTPPIDRVGALDLETFLPKSERRALVVALNTLVASPSFATWRSGATLDVGQWMEPVDGKTSAVIVSVAHLDDDERALVLGVVFEELLAWVRSLAGSQKLRALVVFDEVYGFIPPHPANPPTKRPLVALMKQARAFGVGVVIATQNPMDLDYRALGNAGVWCIGRLQTDADRARVVDGLVGGTGGDRKGARLLATTIGRLGARWFVMSDGHAEGGSVLLQPRYAMSLLRGPMTRGELRSALGKTVSSAVVVPITVKSEGVERAA